MMKIALGTIAAVLMASNCNANSMKGYYTGNELKAFCDSADAADFARCSGYVSGVADEFEVWRDGEKKTECFPSNVTIQQVVDITRKYLDTHPESRNQSAASLIIVSILEAWSCKI